MFLSNAFFSTNEMVENYHFLNTTSWTPQYGRTRVAVGNSGSKYIALLHDVDAGSPSSNMLNVFTDSGGGNWTRSTIDGGTYDSDAYIAMSRDGTTAVASLVSEASANVFNLTTNTKQAGISPAESGTLSWSATMPQVDVRGDGNEIIIASDTYVRQASPTVVTGKAWVFTRSGSTWSEISAITPGDLSADSNSFGRALAISQTGNFGNGDGWVIVGASNSAYLFWGGSGYWSQNAKITKSGTTNFGSVVAINDSGSVCAISEPGVGVHVYKRTGSTSGATWSLASSILKPSGGDDSFGTSIAMSGTGNVIFVGVPNANNNTGEVHVYNTTTANWSLWSLSRTFTGTGNAAEHFGISVASRSDYNLVVGMGGTSTQGTDTHWFNTTQV